MLWAHEAVGSNPTVLIMLNILLEWVKFLAAPLVIAGGWGAHQYVGNMIDQEVGPVKSAVQQSLELQREFVDSQKRTECMNFKYQELEIADRMKECEKESEQRRLYWAWQDCMKREEAKKSGKPANCGPKPEYPS